MKKTYDELCVKNDLSILQKGHYVGGNNMDAGKMGKFIAVARKDNNLTQADLAQKLNVTVQAVSRWERGIGYPDITTLEPLANALDVEIDELLTAQKRESGKLQDKNVTAAIQNTIVISVSQLNGKKNFRLIVTEIILCVIGTLALLYSFSNFAATYQFFRTVITLYWTDREHPVFMAETPPSGYAAGFIGLSLFLLSIILLISQLCKMRKIIKQIGEIND